MGKNTLVINCDIGETRVALIENGILSELHVERRGQRGIVGNICLGKVSRVLPGMQAAFIDIGEERAAFLHVEDLIRPADFEAYLAGSKRREDERTRRPAAKTGPDSEDEEDTADSPEDGPEGIEANDAGEPDAPLLREERGDEIIRKDIPSDEMATRRGGRRRRGSRSGENRSEVETDIAAEAGENAETLPKAEAASVPSEPPKPRVARQPRVPATQAASDVSAASDVPPDAADPATDDKPRKRTRRGGRSRLSEAPGELTLVSAEFTPLTSGEISEEATAERSEAPIEAPQTDIVAPIPAVATTLITPPLPLGAAAGATREFDTPRTSRPAREGRRGRGRPDRAERSDRPDRPPVAAVAAPAKPIVVARDDRPDLRQDPRQDPRRRGDALRLGRSTPINEVVKEGQEVIVQVTKDPIGTKGARVSSHVSLPGRYVVYMPTVEHVGVSRRIGNEAERRRLRDAIEGMKPPSGGLIVRTLAEGLTKKQLKADVGYLVRLWGEIVKKRESGVKAPMLLFQELDVVLRTARDMFTDDIEKIVIDDKEQYQRLCRFIEMFMPERLSAIELYAGDEPIFDAYGLEDEIARALSRKVPLSSGGYLIIDQAEALTAIDVNSGRFVGKGNRDAEDTILTTNMEAVAEIAYQLRFRNIGGLIVLDLIDMEKHSNREKVYRALEQALLGDKAKTSINRISELGLVEMTRKRTRESLGQTLHEACFYCDGTGQLQSRSTIAYEILRQIRRDRDSLAGYKVIVNAHSSIVDLLQNEERVALKEAERRYQRQIMLVPHREYHIEQFDLRST